jgi:hypothetical protein
VIIISKLHCPGKRTGPCCCGGRRFLQRTAKPPLRWPLNTPSEKCPILNRMCHAYAACGYPRARRPPPSRPPSNLWGPAPPPPAGEAMTASRGALAARARAARHLLANTLLVLCVCHDARTCVRAAGAQSHPPTAAGAAGAGAGTAAAPTLPVDPGSRWAVFFSVGDAPTKAAAFDLLGGAPRALAKQYPAITPGFQYADCAAQPQLCQEAAARARGPDEVGAATDGFGLGWFVSMGGGRGRARSVAPMVRYSNATVHGDALPSGERGLSDQARQLTAGVRASTVFAHVRGGDALAMANPVNAPPFLLRADPTHSAAAHAAVQHVGVPSILWMQQGVTASFQMLRPLLLNKIGRARAGLIGGVSEAEHVGALYASLLVENRSHVCRGYDGTEVAAAAQLECERTGWTWRAGRFHVVRGRFWLRFTYVTPVLAMK